MEQIEISQRAPKSKLIDIYNNNKIKILIFFLIITIFSVFFLFLKYEGEKENVRIAEKYIKASYYLASSETDKAKSLYEQILTSGNTFYSILSLNIIIEKNLILDKDQIIDYFNTLQSNITSKEQKDLLILKKALYLIKIEDVQKGNDLLNILIQKNSNLKSLAQEILDE
jgi:hypothetical protein